MLPGCTMSLVTWTCARALCGGSLLFMRLRMVQVVAGNEIVVEAQLVGICKVLFCRNDAARHGCSMPIAGAE